MISNRFTFSDDIAIIKLLDLTSRGTRAHPWATSPQIIHKLLPDDTISSPHGEQHLALRGEFLSFVYHTDYSAESRRGIVLSWRTGTPVYVSYSLPFDYAFLNSTLGFYGLQFVHRFS